MKNEDSEDDQLSKPRRTSLSWRVDVVFQWTLSFIGYWLGRVMEFFEWCGHHVFGIATLILMPWRWFSKKPVAETDAAPPQTQGDLVESSEWMFANVFSAVGFFFAMLFRILVPQKLVEKTDEMHHAATVRTIGFFLHFGERFGEIAERVFPRRLFWPFYWLFGALLDVVDFMAQWWYSRNFAILLWSLPAIVLLMPLFGSTLMTMRYSVPSKMSHYQTALANAEDEGDTDSAVLYRTKLTQLGFEHLDIVEFKTAIELAEEERYDEAYERMKELAPLDEPGLLEAHVWIAGALLNRHIDGDDPWGLLETHLNHALELDPENPLAKRFSVELLIREGNHEKAIQIMEETVRYFPSFHPDLAHLYHLQGNELKSKFHARRAINYYLDVKKQQRKRDPDDPNYPGQWTPRGYLRMAEAYGLLEKRIAELQVLQEAADMYPDDEMLQTTLMQALVSRIAAADLRDADAKQWIETICQRMPNQRVAVAVLGKGLIAEEPHARQFVDELRSKNLLSSDVFERVADTYMSISRFDKAIEYYRETCDMNPDSSYAWNNMAWVWGNIEPLQTDEALAAADRAIELNPDPRFYETRGQILVRLERWDEAVKDLERALNGTIPNASDVHRALAKSYEAMGNTEQAAAHRALIAASTSR